MNKILMKTPLVEMQGDEMTRILWDWIKEILIAPHVELKTEFYDLGLRHRDETDDAVTVAAADAVRRLGVGVKCATITPNAQRMEEYGLKRLYASPNGTIRAALDGTVFRTPILVDGITPYIPTWTKPITIARHAYGDVYKNTELTVAAGGRAELVVTGSDGAETRKVIHTYKGGGIAQGIHNTDASIQSFARSCFAYGLAMGQDVWFATKDTISKTYDGRFKEIFADIFETEFAKEFKNAGLNYDYSLIDDSVARVVRSSGGMIWALKNYDGDVMSDMVATAYGSLAMMTSVLVSPDGKFEFEAAHGTVTRHYYKYRDGEPTSTNSVATIFAWTGALKKRAELDNLPDLLAFAKDLERATIRTIEEGVMTGDLVGLFKKDGVTPRKADSRMFLEEIRKRTENR